MLNDEKEGDDLKKPGKPLVYGTTDNNGSRPQLIQDFYNNAQPYSYYPTMPAAQPKVVSSAKEPEIVNYIDKDPNTLTPAQRIQRDIQI